MVMPRERLMSDRIKPLAEAGQFDLIRLERE
jgi:hypothetical protein